MKNSSMKKYRAEMQAYVNLYQYGIISDEEMNYLVSCSMEKLMQKQLKQQVDNLTAALYQQCAKGLI